jgi:hypothetical protein
MLGPALKLCNTDPVVYLKKSCKLTKSGGRSPEEFGISNRFFRFHRLYLIPGSPASPLKHNYSRATWNRPKVYMLTLHYLLVLLAWTIKDPGKHSLAGDDYKIYSELIRTELPAKTKEVTVLSASDTVMNGVEWLTSEIDSKDLASIHLMTRNANHETPGGYIDSSELAFISGYCKSNPPPFVLSKNFDRPLKIFLVKEMPIREGYDWEDYYADYPMSGGIFRFSKIRYAQDGRSAVFYYSVYRQALNARGSIVVMKLTEGSWKFEYEIVLWQA